MLMRYEIRHCPDGLVRVYALGRFCPVHVGTMTPAGLARLHAAVRNERPIVPPTSPDRRLWAPGHYAGLVAYLRALPDMTALARYTPGRYSDTERAQILAYWAAHKGSQTEFCRAHNLSPQTLARWLSAGSATRGQLRLVAL